MKTKSPQALIKEFVELMHPGRRVEVTGERKRSGTGGKRAPYTAYLILDGKVVLSAQERNWRMAYKTLQINISKGNIL